MKTPKLQTGISLVEIMIALLIGVFLMGGLIQLFISSKQTYKMQDTVSRLQENQRFALDFLVHDMRGLGGWGCFRWPNPDNPSEVLVESLLNSTGVFTSSTSGISGSDGGGATIPDSITLISTSALQTNTGGDVTITIAPNLPTDDLAVSVGSVKTSTYADGIKTNDILFIGDCEGGNIFQVSGITSNVASPSPVHDTIAHAVVTATPGNASASLTKPYNTSAKLYKFNIVTYSIGTGESNQLALFQEVNGNNQELIEGVENMQILYGEDTDADGTPNRYVPAGTASLNMDNVVSVQVTLSMVSLDTTAPIIRRSVTSIISIRNRLN